MKLDDFLCLKNKQLDCQNKVQIKQIMEKDKQIKSFQYFIVQESLHLNIQTDNGIYKAELTTKDIQQCATGLNLSIEKFAKYISNLSIIHLNDILKIQSDQLSIFLGTLGIRGQKKIYLKRPLEKTETISKKLVSQPHQQCKKMWSSTQKKIQELVGQNFQLKLKVETLTYKVDQHQQKFRQILDLIKNQVDKCKQDYRSKLDEMSILISQQKSSQIN